MRLIKSFVYKLQLQYGMHIIAYITSIREIFCYTTWCFRYRKMEIKFRMLNQRRKSVLYPLL